LTLEHFISETSFYVTTL